MVPAAPENLGMVVVVGVKALLDKNEENEE